LNLQLTEPAQMVYFAEEAVVKGVLSG
jgi:hypothetical protein